MLKELKSRLNYYKKELVSENKKGFKCSVVRIMGLESLIEETERQIFDLEV